MTFGCQLDGSGKKLALCVVSCLISSVARPTQTLEKLLAQLSSYSCRIVCGDFPYSEIPGIPFTILLFFGSDLTNSVQRHPDFIVP